MSHQANTISEEAHYEKCTAWQCSIGGDICTKEILVKQDPSVIEVGHDSLGFEIIRYDREAMYWICPMCGMCSMPSKFKVGQVKTARDKSSLMCPHCIEEFWARW